MTNRSGLTHRAPWRLDNARGNSEIALRLVFLLAPLAIGLAWGTYLDDVAYVSFRYARALVAGRGFPHAPIGGGDALLRSPLYVLALLLPAGIGIPLPEAGLVLSAAGWGATALAIYSAAGAMGRRVAAVVSAALVAFSPLVALTPGSEVPWTAALLWIAVASSVEKRWSWQTVAVMLMVCAHFDLSTLAVAALLTVARWVESGRFPLRLGLILAIAALGWGLLAAWCVAAPFTPPDPSLAEWTRDVRQLVDESEFYWLFLPPIGAGLIAALSAASKQKALWIGLPAAAILVLSGDAVSTAVMATLALFLAGLGIDAALPAIARWIERRNTVHLRRSALAVGLVFLIGLPLGLAQATSLFERYRFRPVVRQELEDRASAWLRAHSDPAVTVLGAARVGYLADRPTLPWDGRDGSPAALAHLLRALNEAPPDYCISFDSIAWDHVVQTRWFQDRYASLETFESPYDAASPVTVWGYRASAFDAGEQKLLDVRLPGGVNLVGYRAWPDRIQPGGEVNVTLSLQVTELVTDPFQIVVEIISPADAIVRGEAAHEVRVEWWQTGQVVDAHVVVPTAADIPIGAHHLIVYAMTAKLRDVLPIYQGGDTAPLDRVALGYVVVPWRGEPDVAKPVGADVGDRIGLLSFEAPDSLPPGAEFDVTLYWEATQPPEGDYVVFVHLVDDSGQLVASHDGPPMDGRYPTRAWLPGEIVPDTHYIALDPETPLGTYRLKVGMYHWPSLERLPVWDGRGVERPDRAVVLQSIEVRQTP